MEMTNKILTFSNSGIDDGVVTEVHRKKVYISTNFK